MVDRDLVAAKLTELTERTSRAAAHCPSSSAELAADRDALDLVSFNVMLAVQSALDVASHLIADEEWEPASTLAASFVRLAEHGVITAATRGSMSRAAGLRNVVAHGYAQVDVDLVYRAATDGVHDLERFAAEVAGWVTARSS